ncbi:ABC transporter permease [Mesorhizobium sp.]|uniref:ABC transporter permease n=1 Tax=Mesorhizobium sp. TaxID=1871066 RepID=UPI000FE56D6B|nr:ABC transporter permease [Mesorhizobium sp.]RWI66014.1 MAG: ABC transporter permease [Mesorhizobium sp.]TIN20358.1 MAG: ABC transporter permease [Mesorhizobium sp.]
MSMAGLELMHRHSLAARTGIKVLAWLVLFYIYLPVALLVVFSFNGSPLLVFPLSDFSLRWYKMLIGHADLQHSILNSLIVIAGSVPASLVLGIPLAYGFYKFKFRGKGFLAHVFLVPLIVPGLITGLAILLLLKQLGVSLSLGTVILGHTVAWLPVVVTQIYARLRRFDRRLEEASLDLGANQWQTFWRVVFPNIRVAIVGSTLLVATLSFNDIAITFFLTGQENTLPMHMWSMMRAGFTPEITAVGAITIAVTLGIVALALAFLRFGATGENGVEHRSSDAAASPAKLQQYVR